MYTDTMYTFLYTMPTMQHITAYHRQFTRHFIGLFMSEFYVCVLNNIPLKYRYVHHIIHVNTVTAGCAYGYIRWYMVTMTIVNIVSTFLPRLWDMSIINFDNSKRVYMTCVQGICVDSLYNEWYGSCAYFEQLLPTTSLPHSSQYKYLIRTIYVCVSL